MPEAKIRGKKIEVVLLIEGDIEIDKIAKLISKMDLPGETVENVRYLISFGNTYIIEGVISFNSSLSSSLNSRPSINS